MNLQKMQPVRLGFFTAKTQSTQRLLLFLFSADPRGIGFAFHRAGRPENKKS